VAICKTLLYNRRVGLHWEDEDAAYISSRSARYPGAVNIDPTWTQEVLEDDRLVVLEPYPNSRIGATGFIGNSPSADRVLVVIAYQNLDGDWHGLNACRRLAVTWQRIWKETHMAKKLDPKTSRALREDARNLERQSDSDEPYPASTTISRPNQPSRMFNLRLTEEQFAELQAEALRRHLPVSTMARAWLLDRLDHERHAS
jgi:hypothetical protein